jgi:Fe-Mn family superoxide dismutase
MNQKPLDRRLRRPVVPGPDAYTLPDLPYEHASLEPHIDAQTLRLHHHAHHGPHVTAANRALAALKRANETGDYEALEALTRDLAFHLSGHVLHSLYWTNMAPPGEGGEPSDQLAFQLQVDFGGFEPFKAHFTAAAMGVRGSGWGALVWAPRGQRLLVLQPETHQNLTVQGVTPLLVVDVWEHAYYLQYQNRRDEYIENWWSVVNWADVSEQFEFARRPVEGEPGSPTAPETAGR